MSYFGDGGGADEFFERAGSRDNDWVREETVPPEHPGSGPIYRIDPGSDDRPRLASTAEDFPREILRAAGYGAPAAEYAEIRGQCSVATLEAIVRVLAAFPDEHSNLEYRLGRPGTGSDKDEALNVLTKWKSVSPP